MEVTLIAALGTNRVIGTGEEIPWHLPRDTSHFRNYCTGKALLVGRRTFEEMKGWFRSDQLPMVLTRALDYHPHTEHAEAVSEVSTAVDLAMNEGHKELVVIGGAAVYAAALSFATRMELTEVDAAPSGAAKFPMFSSSDWEKVSSQFFAADSENAHDMAFVSWQRNSR